MVVAKWNLKDKPFSSTKCEPDIQLKHKSGTRGSQKFPIKIRTCWCFPAEDSRGGKFFQYLGPYNRQIWTEKNYLDNNHFVHFDQITPLPTLYFKAVDKSKWESILYYNF